MYYIFFGQDINYLLQVTRKIGWKNPIFCIPVGRDPDMVQYSLQMFFIKFISVFKCIQCISKGY